MRKVIYTIILIAAGFLITTTSVEAAVINKNVSRTYDIRESFVKVTQVSTVSVNSSQYLIPQSSDEVFVVFNPIIEDSEAKLKIKNTLPTIRATTGSGKPLKFTTEIQGQNILINVKRPSSVYYGSKQTIKVTYNSFSLTSRSGALLDIYIPAFSQKFKFVDSTTNRKYSTRVILPKSLGEPNIITPQSSPVDKGDKWIINFTQKQLTGSLSWIQVGTKQFYKFKILQPYEPTSTLPIFYNYYNIVIPRDVTAGPTSQSIHYETITPSPESITLDDNDNLVAEFRVPANEAGVISISGYATLSQLKEIDVTHSGSLSDIPPEIVTANTSAAPFWESDNEEIINQALKLKQDEENVYKLIETTYKYVVDQIDYSNVKRFGINERQGALRTLLGGAAVCMEYSDLFIALLRAQGVPARAAFGYGYDSRSTEGEQIAHQWAEVYIPSLDQWIGVDTTWGEAGPAIIGGDLNHLYKYVASEDPQTPAPVSLVFIGLDAEIKDENFSIEAVREVPEGEFLSQSELIEKYPHKEGVLEGIERFTRSVSYTFNSVDTRMNTWLIENLGVTEATSAIIRVVLYLLPFVLIFGLGTYIYLRKRNLNFSAPPADMTLQ